MDYLFTDRELDIMAVLWTLDSATVAEVRERLTDDLAYTTVLTTLQNLEAKGRVAHESEGKTYRYYPLVARDEAGASAIRRLTRKIFDGSRELLISQMVSGEGLGREELERLQTLVESRLEELDG